MRTLTHSSAKSHKSVGACDCVKDENGERHDSKRTIIRTPALCFGMQ
jgi:hypothetical protein